MAETDEIRDDDLAAEYVLGVQDASVRAELAQRIERDAAFAALVRAWEERLASLNEGYDPVAPPVRVKSAIDDALFPKAAHAGRRGWAWLTGALVAGLAAIAIYVAVTWQPTLQLVAELQAEGSEVVVEVEVRGGDIGAVVVAGQPPDGLVFELWQIAGDNPPASLGLLGTDHNVPDIAFAEGQAIAVSVEPPGGSPTGLPTGAVVAVGVLAPPPPARP